MMLPKERRLKSKKTFDFVFSDPQRLGSKFYSIFWKQSTANPAKFAVVTSKKVGKAHIRNKLRRQVFHILFGHHVYNTPGILAVIVMKSTALELSFEQLSAQLTLDLDKIIASK